MLDLPEAFPVALPRHSFTPREVARASDLWRSCQDVALEASIRHGWPPQRYLDIGGGYLMRQMTVIHERELGPMTQLYGRTWVAENRRDMVSVRQIRLYDHPSATEPVLKAVQQWAYVDRKEGLKRAPAELVNSFPLLKHNEALDLPAIPVPVIGTKSHAYDFYCWHIWRDSMGHLNHPDYVDICDEGILRRLSDLGLATEHMESRGERVLYRQSINAGDTVTVETFLEGILSDEECRFRHELKVKGKLCAEAWTWRRYPGATVLANAFSLL